MVNRIASNVSLAQTLYLFHVFLSSRRFVYEIQKIDTAIFLLDECGEVGFHDTKPEMGNATHGEIHDLKGCHDCVLQIANFRDSGGSDTSFSVGLDTEFHKVEAHDIGMFSHGTKGGVSNTLSSVDQVLAPV